MKIYGIGRKTLIKDKSDKFKICGCNEYKDLCIDGKNKEQTVITEMLIPSNTKQVTGGNNFTIILLKDGTLKVIGYNGNGQLGLGHTDNVTELTDVPDISGVKKVVCGGSNTFLLMQDGSLMASGNNGNGQLGLGHYASPNSFTKLPLTDVKDIICGHYHTIIILNDNTIKGTGYNGYGQLGLGHTDSINEFTLVEGIDNNNIKMISCGAYHTMALLKSGELYGCGYNEKYGALGNGTKKDCIEFTKVLDNVKDVDCGVYHTVAVLNDGSVMGAGSSSHGQVAYYSSYESSRYRSKFSKFDDISNAENVACGDYHTIIKLKNNYIYTLGSNYYGELGIADKSAKTTNDINHKCKKMVLFNDIIKVKCASYGTFLITKDNDLLAMGYSYEYELGTSGKNLLPRRICSFNGVKEIVTRGYNSILVMDDGRINCTGENRSGLFGFGHNNEIWGFRENTEIRYSRVTSAALGSGHSIVLMSDGTIRCAGDSDYGKLGVTGHSFYTSFQEVRNIKNVKRVFAGNNTSFILLEDGTLMGAGSNLNYSLGINDTPTTYSKFTEIYKFGDSFVDMVCGDSHIVVLLKDGTIMVAGNNQYGQLGLGHTDNVPFTKVEGITGVKKISCGYFYTTLLMNDGTVKVAGYNGSGQLGTGDKENRIEFVDVPYLKNIVDITCGLSHNITIDQSGNLFGLGDGGSGQLGLGELNGYAVTPKRLPRLQMLLNKYLLQDVDGNIFRLPENGTLEMIDSIEFDETTQMINDYNKHIKDKSKIIKYYK